MGAILLNTPPCDQSAARATTGWRPVRGRERPPRVLVRHVRNPPFGRYAGWLSGTQPTLRRCPRQRPQATSSPYRRRNSAAPYVAASQCSMCCLSRAAGKGNHGRTPGPRPRHQADLRVPDGGHAPPRAGPRPSQVHRGFDGQPPRGSDIFALGMWHWSTPNPPRNPDPLRSFRGGRITVRSRTTPRRASPHGRDHAYDRATAISKGALSKPVSQPQGLVMRGPARAIPKLTEV
jgi:hypothetical protein